MFQPFRVIDIKFQIKRNINQGISQKHDFYSKYLQKKLLNELAQIAAEVLNLSVYSTNLYSQGYI